VNEAEAFSEVFAALIGAKALTLVERLIVLPETASTQDAARAMQPGGGGFAVLAMRQTSGRGRQGRQWADTLGLGLPVTIVLDAAKVDLEGLSIRVGLGVCIASEAALNGQRLGLRWPNDVVEPLVPRRKVAGVLIEQAGTAMLIGVGVNVLQSLSDWPDELQARAVSLRELGSGMQRPQVLAEVLLGLQRALAMSDHEVCEEWAARDVLRDGRSTFVHANQRYSGLVTRISPTSHLELLLDSGETVILPARTTSLVH